MTLCPTSPSVLDHILGCIEPWDYFNEGNQLDRTLRSQSCTVIVEIQNIFEIFCLFVILIITNMIMISIFSLDSTLILFLTSRISFFQITELSWTSHRHLYRMGQGWELWVSNTAVQVVLLFTFCIPQTHTVFVGVSSWFNQGSLKGHEKKMPCHFVQVGDSYSYLTSTFSPNSWGYKATCKI